MALPGRVLCPTAIPLPEGRTLSLDRPRIMGILNVTPDSFSDGGRHTTLDAAVAQARRMISEGADLVDVGGESTRPGSQPVPADEQIRRTIPVVRTLAAQQTVISIDTTLPPVARAALDAGALIINDVSAGREPGMLDLAAERRVPMVLMHMQGTPATMQVNPTYTHVVAEVIAFLEERANAAMSAGILRDRIILDPGIGFGKTKQHNLALLAALPQLVALGYPVLLGASRKRFMGAICSAPTGQSPGAATAGPSPDQLVGATCATTALGVAAGVRLFRVHDVMPNRQAADVAHAITTTGT